MESHRAVSTSHAAKAARMPKTVPPLVAMFARQDKQREEKAHREQADAAAKQFEDLIGDCDDDDMVSIEVGPSAAVADIEGDMVLAEAAVAQQEKKEVSVVIKEEKKEGSVVIKEEKKEVKPVILASTVRHKRVHGRYQPVPVKVPASPRISATLDAYIPSTLTWLICLFSSKKTKNFCHPGR